MSKKILPALLVALSLILTPHPAKAVLMGYAKPLPQAIAQAQLIVVARLVKYTPDPAREFPSKPTQGLNGQEAYVGEDALYKFFSVKAPGHYSLQVLQMLEGEPVATLEIDLPYLLQHYYADVRYKLVEGDAALFMLKLNTQGQLEPVDRLLPLIPLTSANSPLNLPATAVAKPVPERVLDILLASLSDPTLRQVNTHLLRDMIGPEVVAGLAPYLNDPSLRVQDNVLYAMAVNQQVSVIPHISALAAKMAARGSYPQSVQALTKFDTPEAVPYLNPLLFNLNYLVRFRANDTLYKISDRTSIPYLLIAMHDPQPGEAIAHTSYLRLMRLLNRWDAAKNADNFWPRRAAEMRPLHAWWRDELSGKHAMQPPLKKPLPNLAALPPDEAVAQLNPLLFEASIATRHAAMMELVKRADHSSIPYLLLALQDPDSGIAYSAYTTLSGLLPGLGRPKTKDEFTARLETVTQPLYAWWQDELVGKHLPPPVAPQRPAQPARP